MTEETTSQEREFLRDWEEQRRRRRRRIRLIVVLGVLLLIVLPLLAGFIYDRYWEGKVAAKVAQLRAQGKLLTFQQMLDRCKDLPPEQNSALVYLKAFGQLSKDAQARVLENLQYIDALGTRPSPTLMEMYGSEASANADGLKTILSAALLEQGCYPLQPAPSPWELLLPHCQEIRGAVRLCGRIAVLHAARQQPAQATPYLMAGFGLASSLGHKPFLIEGLVRTSADTAALKALEHGLALCQFRPEELLRLEARLEHERDELTLGPALVWERSAAHFTFERMIGNRKYMHALSADGKFPAVYALLPGWREQDELFYDRMMDEAERIMALPPRQALAQMRQYASFLDASLRAKWPPPVVTAMLLPAISRALRDQVQAKVRLSIAAAALAAEQYRQKNGRWPDSLEELVPEFLDEVPEDWFGTGKVRYEHTESGVILYSVGPDGRDNGGAGQPDADDLTFRLLDPELRGAKTATFREEVVGSGVSLEDLKAAGLDEDALKRLGLSDEDLGRLR